MEDSSLSESEVENKGMIGRNDAARVPVAQSAGFSATSEVHIVRFPAFSFSPCSFFFHCLWSTSLHSCLYFAFAFWPWDPFKPPSRPPPHLTL